MTAEGLGGREINRRTSVIDGERRISCSHVLEWYKRFREGCMSLQDGAQHPPYNPDISPCDFHMFGELKKGIRGHSFASYEDVCNWVNNWFGRQLFQELD